MKFVPYDEVADILKNFVSGNAVIDKTFQNLFEWAPFTNWFDRERHRWHRIVDAVIYWCIYMLLSLDQFTWNILKK